MVSRLGLCSAYSFLYGVHKPGALLDRALSFGVDTASICDRDSLYGVHAFVEAAKERGIRPIIGAALTLNNDDGRAVYCFVRNRAGFGRLCELLTLRNRDRNGYNPLALLREQAEGLVLAAPDGEVLEKLAGRVPRLYGAVTASSLCAVGASRRLNLPLCFADTSVRFHLTMDTLAFGFGPSVRRSLLPSA